MSLVEFYLNNEEESKDGTSMSQEMINKSLLEKIEYFLPIKKRIHKFPSSTQIHENLANTVITALRTNSNKSNFKTIAELRSKSIELKSLEDFQVEIERSYTKAHKHSPLDSPIVVYSQHSLDNVSQKDST